MWGPSPRMLLWTYRSLIVPSFTYGALVWAHQDFNKSTSLQFNKLNRLAAIMTSSFRKSTPTAGLEVILGLKPLDLIARESGLRTYQRLKPSSKWTGLGLNKKLGHIRTWERWGSGLELPIGDTDSTNLRYFNWDPPCIRTSDPNVVEGKIVCTVQVERVDDSVRFHSQIWGGAWGGGHS